MNKGFAGQYGTPCVCLIKGQPVSAQEIIDLCRAIGAVYYEDGPDDECFVVDVDRGVGPEIYTGRALRGSFRTEDHST